LHAERDDRARLGLGEPVDEVRVGADGLALERDDDVALVELALGPGARIRPCDVEHGRTS